MCLCYVKTEVMNRILQCNKEIIYPFQLKAYGKSNVYSDQKLIFYITQSQWCVFDDILYQSTEEKSCTRDGIGSQETVMSRKHGRTAL